MCKICEGIPLEEVLAEERETIEEHGFLIRAVTPSDTRPGWSYTIGLLEHLGHPELVIMSGRAEIAHNIFWHLFERIRQGESFDGLTELRCCRADLRVVPVSVRHLKAGLMNSWYEHQERFGPHGVKLRALQLVLPDELHCAHHQHSQPLLDRSSPATWDELYQPPFAKAVPARRHARHRRRRRPRGKR